MARELKYVITGDARDFTKTLRSVDSRLKDSETRAKRFGDSVKGAIGIGAITSVGLFGKRMLDAANEAEVSTNRMRAQLKALGLSYRDNAAEIDAVIQRTSRLAALDDEELQDSFTNIVRVTGDVNKSLRLVGLAADFARAKNIDVARAGEVVGKVAGGNTGILSRYGIQVRKGATATEALGELQKRFAGQAKAYGESNKGAADQASVAWENLKETLGEQLAPAVRDVSKATTKFLQGMQDGTGAGGDFVRALEDIRDAVKPVVQFLKDHPKLVAVAVGAWGAYKVASLAALAAIKVQTFRKVFMRSVPAATTAGGFAGGAYAAAFNSSSNTGISAAAKGGKLKRIGSLLGKTLGLAAGAALAWEVGKAIERLANPGGITAADLGNESKSNVKKIIEDMTGRSVGPNTPRSRGTDRTDAAQSLARSSRVPGSDPGGGAGSVRPRRRGGGGRTTPVSRTRGVSAPSGGGGGSGLAQFLSRAFKLKFSSGYRTPEQNAAAGGVPNSWHMRGSSSNPGAIDLVGSMGSMQAALSWAQQNIPGLAEAMIHDAGSGLHLHLAGPGVMSFRGGRVPSGGGGAGSSLGGLDFGGVSGGGGGFARRPGLSPAQRAARTAFRRSQAGARRSAGRAVRHEQTMLRKRRAWPRQQHESTLALAELTESPLDDITELERWEGVLEGKLRRARKAGKTGRVTELAQELAGVRSSIGSLKESMDANTDAQAEATQALADAEQARAEALRDLTAEVKRGNDLTERIANTEAPVLKQALADAVSGSIAGSVLRGLGTPAFAGGGWTY